VSKNLKEGGKREGSRLPNLYLGGRASWQGNEDGEVRRGEKTSVTKKKKEKKRKKHQCKPETGLRIPC